MYTLWANLGLLVGGVILAGIAWFILNIVAHIIFDDMIGGVYRKARQRRIEQEKDHYIY